MLDQLRRMAVLAAVVEHRGFGAAARVLGTSTSAVSQQVRALERELGVTLLHRSTRQLQLTTAGERFHQGCAAMVAEARAAQAALVQLRDAPEGELRVASPVGFARQLGPALAPLLAAHPRLTLHLEVDDRLTDLVAARIDLAIRVGRLPDSPWVARRLGEIGLGIYGAPAYLARRGVPGRPDDLADHDWLALAHDRGNLPTLQGPGGERARLPVVPKASSNNQLSLQQLCEAGLGLAMLGHADVADARQGGRLVPLLTGWGPVPYPVYALTPQRDAQPAKVRHAITALSRAWGDAPADLPAAELDAG